MTYSVFGWMLKPCSTQPRRDDPAALVLLRMAVTNTGRVQSIAQGVAGTCPLTSPLFIRGDLDPRVMHGSLGPHLDQLQLFLQGSTS